MMVTSVRSDFVEFKETAAPFSVESLVLEKAPHLRAVYALEAGVSEGYTVLEHSKMVVERALKYRDKIEARLPPCITFERFALFLALHDGGKGAGHSEVPPKLRTPQNMKRAEIKGTILLMEMNQHALGLSNEELALFKALVEKDSMGSYIQNKISPSSCLKLMGEGAKKAHIHINDFITLMDLYHNCDAGSYPGLAKTIFNGFSRRGRDDRKIEELQLFIRRAHGKVKKITLRSFL